MCVQTNVGSVNVGQCPDIFLSFSLYNCISASTFYQFGHDDGSPGVCAKRGQRATQCADGGAWYAGQSDQGNNSAKVMIP